VAYEALFDKCLSHGHHLADALGNVIAPIEWGWAGRGTKNQHPTRRMKHQPGVFSTT
jgi:hypothetical protein